MTAKPYQVRLGWRRENGIVGEDVIGPEDMGRSFSVARGTQPGATDAGAEQVLEQWLAAHCQTDVLYELGTIAYPEAA